MNDQTYPRQFRLKTKEEYDRVLARKCSCRGACLIVYGCENELGHARLGRIVGKRWGNAVARNRIRRWIREAFRLSKKELPALDFVVMIAQKKGLNYSAIKAELVTLAGKSAQKLKQKKATEEEAVQDRNVAPPV